MSSASVTCTPCDLAHVPFDSGLTSIVGGFSFKYIVSVVNTFGFPAASYTALVTIDIVWLAVEVAVAVIINSELLTLSMLSIVPLLIVKSFCLNPVVGSSNSILYVIVTLSFVLAVIVATGPTTSLFLEVVAAVPSFPTKSV